MDPNSANYTAAFIKYDDNWSRNDGGWTESTQIGASFTLPFRGSSLYLYSDDGSSNANGVPPPAGDNQIAVSFVGGVEGKVRDITETLVFTDEDLGPGPVHTVNLTVKAGVFRFKSATWGLSDEYQVVDQVLVRNSSVNSYTTVSNSPQGWKAKPDDIIPSWCTWEPDSTITFTFQGNSILVKGVGLDPEPEGRKISVNVDHGRVAEVLIVRAPHNATFDLYRNDNLGEGTHLVTLTADEPPLCIDQVQYFNIIEAAGRSGQTTAGSATGNIEASPTATLPPDVHHSKSPDGGLIGGIVIGVLLVPLLVLLFFLLWRRHKSRTLLGPRKQYALTRHVSYERVCSACSKPITDDYRLECVDPNCPAAVDLHLECKEWNTPARHSHAVHQVVNE